jgi:FPC/CPF motif-containing protein YcgG
MSARPDTIVYPTCYRLDGEKLVPVDTADNRVNPRAELVHDQLRSLITSQKFSCLGARAALNAGDYWIGVYETMGEMDTTRCLARDLQAFSANDAERDADDRGFRSFIATFAAPICQDERSFEQVVWRQLQGLHDLDRRANDWDPAVSSDPDDPHFAFSVGGRAYFVVGLHAASSRWARRFAWPTLVFNPHQQFDRLREDGIFEQFRDQIRKRDRALQHVLNPMLSNFGEQSEARQYSGRRVEDDWRCPFKPGRRDVAEAD